ncbi:MAG: RHS repeat-associated core domain-containing protein [Chloroflexi bacterium]|nr:RHS repeat-associated core domain-containing protein [Chloroflexota bacterium]
MFGALRSSSGATANDFRYTGQQQDYNANRGMYYLRARTYDPQLGRFLQRDPLTDQPGWTGKPYGYADANPANRFDPTGLDPGDTDRTPVAIPLPPAGTEDLFNRCQMGRDYCDRVIARDEQERRGGSPKLYVGVCNEFFLRCVRHANSDDPDTYFDFDGAREVMRNMSVTGDNDGASWIRDLLGGVRRLPATGSGGLRPPSSKEGGSDVFGS